ncbi:LysR family transcriptional regulator [Paraburkholderia sediminicola]
MDHLQAIRIFVRVVETGGFGRAALSLNMPNCLLLDIFLPLRA